MKQAIKRATFLITILTALVIGSPVQAREFIRGDVNVDSMVTMTDMIRKFE